MKFMESLSMEPVIMMKLDMKLMSLLEQPQYMLHLFVACLIIPIQNGGCRICAEWSWS